MKKLIILLILLISLAGHATTYQIANQAAFNAFDFTSLVAGDIVQFQKGQTFYGTITISDSGSAGNPITFSAYGTGVNPIINGFTTISGWTNEGGGIWSKVITSESQTNMVTIDGVQYGVGRYPNTTYLTYESASTNVSITDNQQLVDDYWNGAEIVIRKNGYTIDRCLVTDLTSGTFTYTSLGTANSANSTGNYFIQNDIKVLDTYGEWYHNTTTGKFSMYFGAVDPTTKTVKVATLDKLFKAASGQDYITIDNVSFIGAIKQAIIFENVNDGITVQNCNISFSGRDGMYLYGSTPTVTNCTLTNCNRVGIYAIGANATVSSNTVSNHYTIIGQGEYGTSGQSAITVTQDNATIQSNVVQNTGANGIFVDATTDTGLVKYNYVYNSCQIKLDQGGIYTAGAHVDLDIESNVVVKSGGMGIYADEIGSYVNISNNSVSECADIGIFLHKGSHCNVLNNTVFNCTTQFATNNGENLDYIHSNTVTGNIFVAKTATQKVLYFYTIYTDYATAMATWTYSNNIYARPIADTTPFYWSVPSSSGNKTLAEWQTFSSQDANSTKSPFAVSAESDLRFEYNETSLPKTVFLEQNYRDIRTNNDKFGFVPIAAYGSEVFLKHDPYLSTGTRKNVGDKNQIMYNGKAMRY